MFGHASHSPSRCRRVLCRCRARGRSRRRREGASPHRRRLARKPRRRLLRVLRDPQVRRPLGDADRTRPAPLPRCRVRPGSLQGLHPEERRDPEATPSDLALTGTEGVYHHEPLETTAQRIRSALRETTGLTLSIGGGTNKLIAKMAVDRAKPSAGGTGVVTIEPGAEEAFLRSCTLADIPLVDPKFQARLARYGLITVADVLRHDLAALELWMSKREAQWLWNRVHGRDEGDVFHRTMNRGISRDETFGKDLREDTDIERELLRLVTRAAADMRGDGLTARTVAVRLRDWDFKTRSAQRTLPEPVVSDRVILRVAHELLATLRSARRVPARLVGVRLSSLAKTPVTDQLVILSEETERDRGLARAIDRVRGKFGAKSILPGGIVEEK